MQRVIRMYGKATVPVLSFVYEGKTYDILETISFTASERILTSCKALGVDAVELHDEAAPMFRDIEENGWLVNPWSR